MKHTFKKIVAVLCIQVIKKKKNSYPYSDHCYSDCEFEYYINVMMITA